MRRRPLCMFCLIFVCALYILGLLGFGPGDGNPLSEESKAYLAAHPQCELTGRVEQSTITDTSSYILLKNASIISKSALIPVKNVRIYLKSEEIVPIGALVVVSGSISEISPPTNPGEFDMKNYYACQHIYYSMFRASIKKVSESYSPLWSFLYKVKDRINKFYQTCGGQYGGVFSAMVLGDKTNLDSDLKGLFQMAGIMHILAISGLHISILGMGLFSLLGKTGMGLRPAALISLAIMLIYGSLSGSSVSALRAIAMFLIMLFARILGRIYDMMSALALTMILLLLESPAYLYNGSFWLSFACVAGIGWIYPRIEKLLSLSSAFTKAFWGSLCVQLFSLPVILYSYGETSLIGIFLNLLVLPTVGAILVSGLLAGLAGMISLYPGYLLLIPGRFILSLYTMLCRIGSRLPICTWVPGAPSRLQCMLYYIVLIIILNAWEYLKKNKEVSRMKSYGLCGLIFASILLLIPIPKREFSITCLDVGQGDAIVVKSPTGETFLMDCGSTSQKNVGQYKLLPYLKHQGIKRLKAVILSHADEDHISGVSELVDMIGSHLTSIRIDTIILPCWKNPPEEYLDFEARARAAGIRVEKGIAGDCFSSGDLKFTLLSPCAGAIGDNANDDGLSIQINYGDFKGLLMGDLGTDTEMKLLSRLSHVDFLKVGHHGSKNSSCSAFLNKITPDIGFISCSLTNSYGHPSPQAVERLEGVGCHLEYTMYSGAITLRISHGHKYIRRFIASDP